MIDTAGKAVRQAAVRTAKFIWTAKPVLIWMAFIGLVAWVSNQPDPIDNLTYLAIIGAYVGLLWGVGQKTTAASYESASDTYKGLYETARDERVVEREKVSRVREVVFQAYLDSISSGSAETRDVLRELSDRVREIQWPEMTETKEDDVDEETEARDAMAVAQADADADRAAGYDPTADERLVKAGWAGYDEHGEIER